MSKNLKQEFDNIYLRYLKIMQAIIIKAIEDNSFRGSQDYVFKMTFNNFLLIKKISKILSEMMHEPPGKYLLSESFEAFYYIEKLQDTFFSMMKRGEHTNIDHLIHWKKTFIDHYNKLSVEIEKKHKHEENYKYN